MLKRVQYGWDGFYFTDGIYQTLSLQKVTNPTDPEDFYFQKNFINATLLNGSEIEDSKIYRGVTSEFLLQGGDDFIKAFGTFINPQTRLPFPPIEARNVQRLGGQRQLIYEELIKMGDVGIHWAVGVGPRRMTVITKQ